MRLKTLIIKLGALGDVVRTTPLLRALDSDIYWVTRQKCIQLLPRDSNFLKSIIELKQAKKLLRDTAFDLVLCLDDDFEAAQLATAVNKNKVIGSFLDTDGKITYTDSASEWFDIGLISRLGKAKADELKKNNTRTYQEIIFNILGIQFSGEEYVLPVDNISFRKNIEKAVIGIEARADDRWPTKKWNKYGEVAALLCRDGFEVRFFKQRKTIKEYIQDINECDLVITGDTLALHIALALKIKVVAVFTCTSPTEIYGYGRMTKVVSPLLDKAFYVREYIPEAAEAVSLESVYNAIKTMIGTPYARSIHNNSY